MSKNLEQRLVLGKPRNTKLYQATYPAGLSVFAGPGPVCAAAPCLKAASRRWDLSAEKIVLDPGRTSPAQANLPLQLGRTATYYRSYGSEQPPQRLSRIAVLPDPPVAGSRERRDCQRFLDPTQPWSSRPYSPSPSSNFHSPPCQWPASLFNSS